MKKIIAIILIIGLSVQHLVFERVGGGTNTLRPMASAVDAGEVFISEVDFQMDDVPTFSFINKRRIRYVLPYGLIEMYPNIVVHAGAGWRDNLIKRFDVQDKTKTPEANGYNEAINLFSGLEGEYKQRAENLEKNMTLILVDMPLRIFFSKGESVDFDQIMYFGLNWDVVYVPKLVWEDFDMKERATFLNEVEKASHLGKMFMESVNSGFVPDKKELRKKNAVIDDPYSSLGNMQAKMQSWAEDNNKIKDILIQEADKLYKETKKYENFFKNLDKTEYKDRVAIGELGGLYSRLAYVFDALGEDKDAFGWYARSIMCFKRIQMVDEGPLLFNIEFRIISNFINMGQYEDALKEYTGFLNGLMADRSFTNEEEELFDGFFISSLGTVLKDFRNFAEKRIRSRFAVKEAVRLEGIMRDFDFLTEMAVNGKRAFFSIAGSSVENRKLFLVPVFGKNWQGDCELYWSGKKMAHYSYKEGRYTIQRLVGKPLKEGEYK
ncbi:MAG: hypothetical protein ABIB11_03090, partial [Candidatus Omnitrophota bacterium]